MREREEGTRVPGAGRVTARPRSIMGLVVRLVEPSFSDDQRRSGTDFLKGRTESRARPKRRPYLDVRHRIGKRMSNGAKKTVLPLHCSARIGMRLSKDSSRWQPPTSTPWGSLPKGNDWVQMASFLNDQSRRALPQGSLADGGESANGLCGSQLQLLKEPRHPGREMDRDVHRAVFKYRIDCLIVSKWLTLLSFSGHSPLGWDWILSPGVS
ncbi:uncharacterized protein LOC114691469 isoform X2 [Peromyscus leucopus]|uniref:uncharacterized protein LOC114691469 isoform X2 n=1 Tax=Peromyscus leucopus TaxID=10041 RepID=UPI0010A11B97|nr:uncharacterized protein LOC114691469 isoform X2 [Peromyscus leucopus]